MGTAHSQNTLEPQNISILSLDSPSQLRILQWRSNPQYNEFIPKVFFQYQQNKPSGTFLSQCKFNENLPIGVKYEKFVGNVTLLHEKLCFQECLYVLKSLLSGFQTILGYFGQAIVDANFCFLTKDGEVKAWINEDYRRNSFSHETSDSNRSSLDDKKLFLKPQKWIDHNKASSSPANIIQKILFLVAQLTNQQNEFNNFLQKLDVFITSNILKNYNFNRITRFINRFIYQNRLFVKSNLFDAIQRIYYENFKEKQPSCQSFSQKEYLQERFPTQMSTITETRQPEVLEISQPQLRKCVSHDRKQSNLELKASKNSQFFNSTANTNTNTVTRCYSPEQSNPFGHFREAPLSGSPCSSMISGYPFMEKRPTNMLKNHISPQFSLNCATVTTKILISQKKLSSLNGTPKSSFISSKSSMRNKIVDFKIELKQEKDLKIITQRKETEPQEKYDLGNRKTTQYPKTSLQQFRKRSLKQEQIVSKSSSNKSHVLAENIVEINKKSNISIAWNSIENNFSFTPKPNLKMFKSNCEDNEKENRKMDFYYTGGFNPGCEKDGQNSRQEPNNIFTMKTITKLLSSNENLSNQQQSEGDFPSNENVSSYSGILASMGRSAELLEIPDVQKVDFRSNKKQKTMFVSNPTPIDRAVFKSYDRFQAQ